MRFQIKSTAGKIERDSDGSILRFTGNSEPFARGCEMDVAKIGVESDGSPRLQFSTGLNEKKIAYYNWLSENEKEEYRKLLNRYKPVIEEYFGGREAIEDTNKYFWSQPERRKIRVENDTLNKVFDTDKSVEHALLYFNIKGGGFLEIIAPNREMAENPNTSPSLYILLENEVHDQVADDYATKADAYMNLRTLDKEEGGDALLYLAWILQADSKGFGGYTRSTPKSELLKYHGEFIEGKLSRTKKDTPKKFVQISDKWREGGLVRESLQIEAYLKAAEYYSYLNVNREKRYELPSGVVLGASIEEVIENIRKPKNAKDLQALRNFVEAKWKE